MTNTTRDDVQKALGTGVLIEAVQSLTGADAIAPDHLGRGSAPTALTLPETTANVPIELQREVELLLYRQAAMLDAKQWKAWTELFTDDGIYWMPAAPEQTDWASQPSVFAEDRWLMEVRMGRLLHPNAWSQAALWGTNHIVGSVIVEAQRADEVRVYSRFQMMEMRREHVRHFGGSYRHTLVRTPAGLRIRLQRVDLMNVQAPFDYVIQAWV